MSYITMKQVPGGTVTAVDDRILYDVNLHSGIIKGCEISYTGNNMIHINAGYGVIKGGLFEMEDHTEYVNFAESVNTPGQIYLHLDLAADDKLTIVKETSAAQHVLVQNDNANFENGVYEIQLCTFTATTTALENVTQTFPMAAGAIDFLGTLPEIMANTNSGKVPDALAIKALNTNLTQSLVDIDLKFDTTTNKPMYRQHGIGNFVNFSGGLDNVEVVASSGNATSLSHTFTQAYSSLIVVASANKGTQGSYSLCAISASGTGFTLEEQKSVNGWFSMNNIYVDKTTKVYTASDVEVGDKLTISITNANLGQYIVLGSV